MLDGLIMEKRGIPAAVICTEVFMEQGRNTAYVHGFAEYPIVEVFHPITNASIEDLNKEAERVQQEVIELLLA